MATVVKERAINARTWEARAMLSGQKTQMRRHINPQPVTDGTAWACYWKRPDCHGRFGPCAWGLNEPAPSSMQLHCRHGQVGERLWVRERWAENYNFGKDGMPYYRADYPDDYNAALTFDHAFGLMKWQSAMHMPREYSRITLEITDVRAQRLQEISERDSWREGLESEVFDQTIGFKDYMEYGEWFIDWEDDVAGRCGRLSFQSLWQSLYGPDAWKQNPWVWAITFKRV